MITTQTKNIYKAFGLNIKSVIPLPELTVLDHQQSGFDLEVEIGDLVHQWEQTADLNRYIHVFGSMVLFHVPGTAIYGIENGKKIIVSPMEGSHPDHIRLYLLGTCMGVILMQRNILPLHGSAVVINGKAYAIVGDSGAGKSTLASAFLKKGFLLVSDDVIPVTLSNEGIPFVTPAYPQQKLWEESLHAFRMDSEGFKPIIDREKKFAVPVPSQFAAESKQLAGIFELVKTHHTEAEIVPITNLMRFHTLFNHTYRNFLLARMGLMKWHFKVTANIIHHTNLFQLQRPVGRFTADDLTSLVLNTIHGERKM